MGIVRIRRTKPSVSSSTSQQGCNPLGVCLSQRWWSPSNTRLIFNGIWWFNRINFSSVCLYLNNNTGTWWAIGKWRPLRDHRSNHCVIDDVNSGISTSSSSSSSCCWTLHSRTSCNYPSNWYVRKIPNHWNRSIKLDEWLALELSGHEATKYYSLKVFLLGINSITIILIISIDYTIRQLMDSGMF